MKSWLKEAKNKEFKPWWEINSCRTAPLKKLTDQHPSSGTISWSLELTKRPSEGTSPTKLPWSMDKDTLTWKHCSPHRLAQNAVPAEISIPGARRAADDVPPARGDPTAFPAEDKMPWCHIPVYNLAKDWGNLRRPSRRLRHPEKRPSSRPRQPRQRPNRRPRYLAQAEAALSSPRTLHLVYSYHIYIMSVLMPGYWCSFHVIQWPTVWQRDIPDNNLVIQRDRPGAAQSPER